MLCSTIRLALARKLTSRVFIQVVGLYLGKGINKRFYYYLVLIFKILEATEVHTVKHFSRPQSNTECRFQLAHDISCSLFYRK